MLLACHGFAQLVGKDEGGLILDVQIAAKLESGNALGAIHEDRDCGEQIDERQLAAGEDRAAGNRELVMTGNALELAARGNVIGLDTAATRANRFAVRFGPAHRAERLIGAVFAHGENCLEAQGASLGREQKMLAFGFHCHRFRCLCIVYSDNQALLSMTNISHMMIFTS